MISASWLKWLEGTKSNLTAQINLNRLNSQIKEWTWEQASVILSWLHSSPGQSAFWLSGSCCAFQNPTKVRLVTLWHAKTILPNLFTWRPECLRNNTRWIMQMWRDEPLAVQPLPPDPRTSVHVRGLRHPQPAPCVRHWLRLCAATV